MRTDSQIKASRANGAKSRGPVTAAGKTNSSQNAIKHGAFAQTILLKRESQPHFDAFAQSLRDEFQPATPFEHTLVDGMIGACWRSGRFGLMEQALLDLEFDRTEKKIMEGVLGDDAAFDHTTTAAISFRSLAEGGRALDLLDRYKSRCDRQYLRFHRRLMEVQDRRGNTPPAAPSPAQVEQPEQTRQPAETAQSPSAAGDRISPSASSAFPRPLQIFTTGVTTAMRRNSSPEMRPLTDRNALKTEAPPLMAAA